MNVRSLVSSGDIPTLVSNFDKSSNEEESFLKALCFDEHNKFHKVSSLFSRETGTDVDLGRHYIYGLIGSEYSGGRITLHAISKHHNLPLLDLTQMTRYAFDSLSIRDIIDYIDNTPPRCMILVRLSNTDDKFYKVIQRLSSIQVNVKSRRVLFCMTTDKTLLPSGVDHDDYPGTIVDRISTLLYLVPSSFGDPVRLGVIAKSLMDYSVFEPQIRKLIPTNGTSDEYFNGLQYQISRRNVVDLSIDDFPSFETEWRKSLSVDLEKKLLPNPENVSQSIHRVIPVGTSPYEVVEVFQSVLPNDIIDPYTLTVASDATDEVGGSIFITQPNKHVVVNINCNIDPGIMTQICRELRSSYRLIVRELHNSQRYMNEEISELKCMVNELKKIVDMDNKQKRIRKYKDEERVFCSKPTCKNLVNEKFSNGKFKKQCLKCISIVSRCSSNSNQTT